MVLTDLLDFTFWSMYKMYSGIYYLMYGNVEKREREKTRIQLDELNAKEMKNYKELEEIKKDIHKISETDSKEEIALNEMKEEIKELRKMIKIILDEKKSRIGDR